MINRKGFREAGSYRGGGGRERERERIRRSERRRKLEGQKGNEKEKICLVRISRSLLGLWMRVGVVI